MHANRFEPPRSEISTESEKRLDRRSRALILALTVQLGVSGFAFLGLVFLEYIFPMATPRELTVEGVMRLVPAALGAWGIWSLVRRSARAPGVCLAAGLSVLLHIGSVVPMARVPAIPLSGVTFALAVSLLWSGGRERVGSP